MIYYMIYLVPIMINWFNGTGPKGQYLVNGTTYLENKKYLVPIVIIWFIGTGPNGQLLVNGTSPKGQFLVNGTTYLEHYLRNI